ncbi:MAG TPA: ATP-binding protein [Actinocrinis sp.]|nr:ATP-binding protein [Actinocrinis sp.]
MGKIGHTAGLPPDRLRDLLLAVTEIAANSIRHGGGSGTMRVWARAGAMVCELRDQGVITDPLTGRVRPVADRPGGRGLWFAHQLCDLVEIRSVAGEGTRV